MVDRDIMPHVRQELTMSVKKRIASTSGIELVRRLAAEGDRIFTMERARELAPEAGVSADYLRQALHHLVRSGWLVRLRKGLYAICSAMPGVTPVHEFEIAMAVVSPAAISHWSAMHFHGLTDQAPRKVFVLTTTGANVPRLRGKKAVSISGTAFTFVQTKRDWFFGTMKAWVGEAQVVVTDPERTLLDGLSMPQYCGDFAEVLHAFEVRGRNLVMDRIIGYALRMDVAAAKRLGWVLEKQGTPADRLRALQEVPAKGYRPLDPSGPRKGPCNRHWMIQENLQCLGPLVGEMPS